MPRAKERHIHVLTAGKRRTAHSDLVCCATTGRSGQLRPMLGERWSLYGGGMVLGGAVAQSCRSIAISWRAANQILPGQRRQESDATCAFPAWATLPHALHWNHLRNALPFGQRMFLCTRLHVSKPSAKTPALLSSLECFTVSPPSGSITVRELRHIRPYSPGLRLCLDCGWRQPAAINRRAASTWKRYRPVR